jgi:enoyl-CoA hydratase/carnithine racemase
LARAPRQGDVDLAGPLEGLRYEKAGGVARITIDRPDRANSLTKRMEQILRVAWADVREDPDVRVAIVGAAGEKHFSTGLDVGSVGEDGAVANNLPLDQDVFWSPRQNGVWKPVLCCVNGLAVGAGLHFVVDADVVLASENAAFMDTHVNVGMVGALENVGLARRLPLGAALRMTLLGRHYRMPARRAYELGLVDELVNTPADLLPAALEMARAIAEASPQAVALSKQAVWGSQERGYRDALEYAWALLRLHWAHPDFEEGPRAFAERRPPRWNPDPNARRGERGSEVQARGAGDREGGSQPDARGDAGGSGSSSAKGRGRGGRAKERDP